MEILFVDDHELLRYSTVTLAKECLTNPSIQECSSYEIFLDMMRASKFNLIFINSSVIPYPKYTTWRKIKKENQPSRMILVIDNKADKKTTESLLRIADGNIDLRNDFSVEKVKMSEYLSICQEVAFD